MSRKSTVAELQAEEAATNSPLRRSSRIVNSTAPAGVVTRRTSQTLEPQPSTPARATRGRRASAQDSEEKIETKPAVKTRRASIQEESQKETVSTPTKRGRKPSVTIEPIENEESEKPKTVRGRRTSTASTTEESVENKPQKTAPVRTRRGSANVEPETEVLVATKTPARATSRRRSSAADNELVPEEPLPAKRTTRGRKASDADKLDDITEEVKKPAARGRKKSLTQESKNEESLKPAERRRRPSTDDAPANTVPKTPVRSERRPSINKEADSEDFPRETIRDSSEAQKSNTNNDGNDTEEEMSPIVLKEMSVRVTPLKKRKILDKMEAELDLSIINESSGDIDNSKHEEYSKEVTEDIEETKEDNKSIKLGENKNIQSTTGSLADPQLRTSPQENSLKGEAGRISPINSLNSTNLTKIETMSATSPKNTPSKKRSDQEDDSNPSPRKSPRLTEKLSKNNTPKEGFNKVPTPIKLINLIKENDVTVNEKSQASFVSSGSDGSFKFHLSNVSIVNSVHHDSHKENAEDVLNTSKESTGSNKENIEEVVNLSKTVLDTSAKIPLQEPIIVVARVSNAFKPNQKNYSFMEPMEVDEDSIISSETSIVEKSTGVDKSSSMLDQKTSDVSTDDCKGQSVHSDDSVVFNRMAPKKMAKELSDDSTENSPYQQTKTESVSVESESAKIISIQNLTEKEGSETNLIIEETLDTVNFSIKPKTEKVDILAIPTTKSRSKSPKTNDASLIINQPLEQVKVVLLGKSSSPIKARRKSKSPIPKATDSESDVPRRSKSPSRRSSSKSPSFVSGNRLSTENIRSRQSLSKSPSTRRSASRSPNFISGDVLPSENELILPQRSKSKSKSPSSRRSSTRSPSFLVVDCGDDDASKPRKSKSPAARNRSQSKSPLLDSQKIVQDSRRSRLRRSVRSKSKSPTLDSQNRRIDQNKEIISPKRTDVEGSVTGSGKTPVIQKNKKSGRSIIKSLSKSPLPHSQQSLVAQGHKQLVIKMSRRSNSKSPLPEPTVLEQSFENPKGTEEIIVITEKKSAEPSDDVKATVSAGDKGSSLKHLPDYVTTNTCKTAESQLTMSDINCTGSEQTCIQDKTEYHTALATTQESAFTSLLNTDNEATQSHIEDPESNYDFDLDSDVENLLESKESSSVRGIETSILDKQTLALQKELANQSQAVAEITKASRRSKSPRKNEISVITEKSQELRKVSNQINFVEVLKDDKGNNDSFKQDDIPKYEGSFTDSPKTDTEKAAETELLKTEDNDSLTRESQSSVLEEQSEVIAIINNSDSTKSRKNAIELAEAETNDKLYKNSKLDSQDISSEDDDSNKIASIIDTGDNIAEHMESESEKPSKEKYDKNILEEQSTNMSVRNESQVEVEDEESNVDLNADLNKVDNSGSENKKERVPEDANKEIQLDTGTKDEVSEDTEATENQKKNRKRSKGNNQDLNKSTAISTTIESRKKQEDQKDFKGPMEEAIACKIAAQKVDTSQSNNSSSISKKPKLEKHSKSTKTKPSLEEYAASKLEEYLNSKADELEKSSSEEGTPEYKSESEYNEFIDGMAEEGEEDSPFEDSNEIIDEGESVGFSSSEELSDDDYDSSDSFICDEELLSGDEYILGIKKKKAKKSRIIDPSSLGEEDIIKIPKKKTVEEEKPKRRSRIISISDSSGDEQIDLVFEVTEESKPTEINEPIVIEETKYEDTNEAVNTTEDSKETKYVDANKSVIIIDDSKVVDSSKEMFDVKSDITNIDSSSVIKDSNNESASHNVSLSSLNTSVQKRNRKSSLSIQENILVDGIKDSLITKRINTLVESFCSSVQEGEISLNLSLEYEGTPQVKDKNKIVHVLSDIKICSGKPAVSEKEQAEEEKKEDEKVIVIEDTEQGLSKLSTSLNETEDLRQGVNKKTLKRRLSKSVDDINEEVNAAKRRKMHKKDKAEKKEGSNEEKLAKRTNRKTKKQNKLKTSVKEELRTKVLSFGIMNQLITDVKNRPKRTIKPTITDAEVENTWTTTTVSNLKPSTSPVTKKEKNKIQAKLHPKDFRNQMLSDTKRVKRIATTTLLKKKGAYY